MSEPTIPDFIARAIEAQGRTTADEVAEKMLEGGSWELIEVPEPEQEVLDVGSLEPDVHA